MQFLSRTYYLQNHSYGLRGNTLKIRGNSRNESDTTIRTVARARWLVISRASLWTNAAGRQSTPSGGNYVRIDINGRRATQCTCDILRHRRLGRRPQTLIAIGTGERGMHTSRRCFADAARTRVVHPSPCRVHAYHDTTSVINTHRVHANVRVCTRCITRICERAPGWIKYNFFKTSFWTLKYTYIIL